MKIYSLEKFKEDLSKRKKDFDSSEHYWAIVCDGHEVKDGKIFMAGDFLPPFESDDDWEVEV